MGTFLGEPVRAEPPAPRPGRRRRLESCVVGAIVACPLACVVLVGTRSFASAGAVVAGSAIVSWLRPFPRRGPIERGALIVWAFYASLVMALLDVTIREVMFAMAGGYY